MRPEKLKNVCINPKKIKQMEREFVETREREMQKYPSDLPVFVFLRRCRKEAIDVFEKILFCFGEIDCGDKKDRETVSWIVHKQDLPILREAFRTICPRGRLRSRDLGHGMVEVRLLWEDDNDIDPVVFDKIVFPDFCIIPKRDLSF